MSFNIDNINSADYWPDLPKAYPKYKKNGRYIETQEELDIAAEMSRILSEEIKNEIDKDMIDRMKQIVNGLGT